MPRLNCLGLLMLLASCPAHPGATEPEDTRPAEPPKVHPDILLPDSNELTPQLVPPAEEARAQPVQPPDWLRGPLPDDLEIRIHSGCLGCAVGMRRLTLNGTSTLRGTPRQHRSGRAKRADIEQIWNALPASELAVPVPCSVRLLLAQIGTDAPSHTAVEILARGHELVHMELSDAGCRSAPVVGWLDAVEAIQLEPAQANAASLYARSPTVHLRTRYVGSNLGEPVPTATKFVAKTLPKIRACLQAQLAHGSSVWLETPLWLSFAADEQGKITRMDGPTDVAPDCLYAALKSWRAEPAATGYAFLAELDVELRSSR
jgi:hypothetical protein